jgi:hypothetical protein
VWLAVGGLGVLCLLLVVALLRLRAAGARSRAEVEALRERLETLELRRSDEGRHAASPSDPVEYVITDLGAPGAEPAPEPPPLDAPAFTDLLLKETVVKAASFAHGVRRGLAPATRNRIRFEMRQEVRRSRKQRRSDLKAAQRDLRARQRATLDLETEEAS